MPAAVDVRLLRAAVFAAACVALASGGHLAALGDGVAPATVALGWLIVFALAATLTGRQRTSLPAVAGLLAAAQVALHGLFSLGHGTSTGTGAGSGAAVAHQAGHQAGQQAGGAGTGTGGVMELASRLLCNDHTLVLTAAEAERVVRDAGLVPPPADPTLAAGHHAVAGPGAPLDALDALAAFGGIAEPRMLAGHLLAALLTGWLLLRGEAALWRLIRLSARCVPQPLRVAVACARLLAAGLRPADAAPVRPRPSGPHPTAATRGTVLPDTVIRRGPPAVAEQLTLAA